MLRLVRLRPPPRCPCVRPDSPSCSPNPRARHIHTPASPGIPPALYLNIKLPDLAQPDPVPPVQIPYLPDFWDSSTAGKVPIEQPLPKLLVVGDASAHHSGGPMHNLLEETTETVDENVKAEHRPPSTLGILSDMASDLGLAPLEEMKKNWRQMLS